MHSRMYPKYYLSSEIFEREQRKIFRKVWLFAGLKTLLTKHNEFITRKISGIPVVIQNFHGELHAFENICLHRGSPLQTEPVGCRPLVCRYHAWRYDEGGQVANIPECDAIYQFGEAERKGMRLREFALRAIGNILFVNLDPQPLPLEEQFSTAFIDLLESSSNAYDNEVMTTTWRGNFNWKLAYENLRDAHHPRFVHGKSLAKIVKFTPSVDSVLSQETLHPFESLSSALLHQEMRRFSYGGAEAQIPKRTHFGWQDMVERWGHEDVYYNWLAFPNLHIASADGGHAFTLEHHVPIAPNRTDVEIYWFTAKKKQKYAFSSQVLLAQMHGSKQVLGEDIAIMEAGQSALHESAPLPTQGAYEAVNRLVERWYTALMDTSYEI